MNFKYDTIKKIEDIKHKIVNNNIKSIMLSSSCIIGGVITSYLEYQYVSSSLFTLISIMNLGNSLLLSIPINVEKSKEIIQIRNIYNDIMNEYCKLHKTFEVNDALEMYFLYCVAYSFGYLSVNKNFEYNTNYGFVDIESIMGVNVINGVGVCRHITAMLADIYSNSFIESYKIPVTNKLFSNEPNHVINMCLDNQTSLYLDPTNYIIFEKFEDGILNYDDTNYRILNSQKSVNNYLNLPLKQFESEDIEKYIKFLSEIIGNRDILNKFYNENFEKYEDINSKILILKKKDVNKRII